jgi:hypothetical protein
MTEDLERLSLEMANSPPSEAASLRLVELVKDIQLQREIANNRDIALAEQAHEIKRVAVGPTVYQSVADPRRHLASQVTYAT